MGATSAPRARALALPRRLLAALDDARLVEHVRRGNEAAFEVIFDRHHLGLLAYCRHLLGSREEAEDALQHTFAAAYQALRADERAIELRPWLYAIARNRCLGVLRARREQPAELDEPAVDGLAEAVQRRDDLRALVADLQELPEEQRTALVLAEVSGLRHGEIAGLLGCEAAKVKSLVYQARAGLIERRKARETPCEEIREQLAVLRGGSLRRGPIRRHLKACPACAAFREEVRRQRAMLALALPVLPSAELKANVLAAVGIGGGTAAGGGTALAGAAAVSGAGGSPTGGGLAAAVSALGAKAGGAKLVAALAAGAVAVGGGTYAVTQDAPPTAGRPAQLTVQPGAPASGQSRPASPATPPAAGRPREAEPGRRRADRPRPGGPARLQGGRPRPALPNGRGRPGGPPRSGAAPGRASRPTPPARRARPQPPARSDGRGQRAEPPAPDRRAPEPARGTPAPPARPPEGEARPTRPAPEGEPGARGRDPR
jgi:RNA polymerase sigma factor (sigma-70 family)